MKKILISPEKQQFKANLHSHSTHSDGKLTPEMVEHIFREKKEVKLEPFFARLARAGQEIYLKKIGASIPEGELVRLTDSEGFFALGEVRSFEAGLAIKPIRQF